MGWFHDNGPMQARLLAFVIWAAVAASAVFWLLRLWSSSPTAPPYTTVPTTTTARGDLTRVFGAPPTAPAAGPAAPTEPALASRFKLLGVAAPRQGGSEVGLALIAVDGKPARGFKVGAAVDGNLVLQSVHPRGAALGPSGAAPAVALELPALAAAMGGGMRASPSAGAMAMPMMPPPGGGPVVLVPPPPPLPGPVPGMRPPEAGETNEPEPVVPGRGGLTR
jgi:general secretion pathway protein C